MPPPPWPKPANMCLFRKNLRRYLSLFWQAAVRDRLKQMGHGVQSALCLLEHKGAIPLFLLIYSLNKYLFCPFYVPNTAGKESKHEAKWSTKQLQMPGVTSDTQTSFMRAQLNSRNCQLEQQIYFMPWTGFLGTRELQKSWTIARKDWEKQEMISTFIF